MVYVLRGQAVMMDSDLAMLYKVDTRTLPYVFNKQGIAMLSAVLRSDIAIQVSIRIMETFVEMRKYMTGNTLEHAYHIGASLKDAGNKCFAINRLEDMRIVWEILQRLIK